MQESNVNNNTSTSKGDVNGDGQITATDYVLIKNHIMSSTNIDAQKGDVNGDGQITATDYVLIKNHIMYGNAL